MTRAQSSTSEVAVRVENVRVELLTGVGIVDEVSFHIEKGAVHALVGESGSGKTAAALAMLGYARPGSRIAKGAVMIGNIDILALQGSALRRARGGLVSYVPQDPSLSLDPAYRVEDQVAEMFEVHFPEELRREERVCRLLELVQLPTSAHFRRRYPHQLSGGQQQRVVIAMALACAPEVVVLDEPTTSLDVTTQKHVLEMIGDLRRRTGVALLYVTHNLSVVAELADRVSVMYGGRIVETAPRETIFHRPKHPYTLKLIRSIPSVAKRARLVGIPGGAVAPEDRSAGCPFAPRCEFRKHVCDLGMPPAERISWDHVVRCFRWGEAHALSVEEHASTHVDAARAGEDPLLTVENLVASYEQQGRLKRRAASPAVTNVTLVIRRQEYFAVVGESGSGKTTLARCIVGLHTPASGIIKFAGEQLQGRARDRPRELRQLIQFVFQNPDASLNPRQTVGAIIGRPLSQFFGLPEGNREAETLRLLELVRLPTRVAHRYPRELSGGEKQRVAIARALAAKPKLVICDEITSSLDVSVQAVILDLLNELRAQLKMSLLFISHDLAVVRSVADRIAVMRAGTIREEGSNEEIFESPQDDYTRLLLAAAPRAER